METGAASTRLKLILVVRNFCSSECFGSGALGLGGFIECASGLLSGLGGWSIVELFDGMLIAIARLEAVLINESIELVCGEV